MAAPQKIFPNFRLADFSSEVRLTMIFFFYFCSLFTISICTHEKSKGTVAINFDLDYKVLETANIDAYCAKNYAGDRNLCLQNLKTYCFGLSLLKKSPESALCTGLDQSGLPPPNSSAAPKVAPPKATTRKARKAPKIMLDQLNEKINHEQTKKASSDVMSYNDRTINNRLFFKQSDTIKNFRFRKTELDVNRAENYFHGDVDLTEKQVKIIEENINKNKKKANEDDKNRKKKNLRRVRRKVGKEPAFHLWTKFPIPYDFVDAVPMKMRIIIEEAIQVWQNNTCVRWQKNGVGVDRIEFVDGDGCSSFIGKVDGTQEISLHYPGCELVGIAAHEIGHSLGFFHEQSRPDQKENVVINYDNIVKSRYNNFSPMDWKDVNAYKLPYDFGSVMHYDGFTRGFTVDPDKYSIVTLDPSYQNTIGQRVGPSFIDFKQINAAYCANTCPKKIGCQNNGYENPNDCNRCKCPPGFGGPLCETVESSNSADCGGRLKLTPANDVSSPKYLTSPKYPDKFPTDLKCNWLIEGPSDVSKISLEFIDGDAFDLPCNVPCADSYLEIKADGDFQRTGPRFCCNTLPKNHTFLSHGSKMIVIFRSSDDVGKGFRVRYYLANGSVRVAVTAAPTTIGGGQGALTPGAQLTTLAPAITTLSTDEPDGGTEPTNAPGCECQQWSTWSDCSHQCGGCGTKSRLRSCGHKNCFSKEVRHCNFDKCPPDMTVLVGGGEFRFLFYGCCFGLVSNSVGKCAGLAEAFREYVQSLRH